MPNFSLTLSSNMEGSMEVAAVRPYLKNNQSPARIINNTLSLLALKIVSTASSRAAASFVGSFIFSSTVPRNTHLFHENAIRRFLEGHRVVNELGVETSNLNTMRRHYNYLCALASTCFFGLLLTNEGRFNDLIDLTILATPGILSPCWMARIIKKVTIEADGTVKLDYNNYPFIMDLGGSPNYFIPVASTMKRCWENNPDSHGSIEYSFEEEAKEETEVVLRPL